MVRNSDFIGIVVEWRVTIDAIASNLTSRSCSIQPDMVSDHPVGKITHITEVVRNARQGSGDPLSALSYSGELGEHPACRKILAFVGTGKKGREVRARFEAPPYGWTRDAVDGSLLTLLSAGILRAASNGMPVTAREVDQGKIGAADFRSENIVVPAGQRIAVRKLFAAAGIDPPAVRGPPRRPTYAVEQLAG